MAALRSPARNLIAPKADWAGSAAWGANRITLRLVRPGVGASVPETGAALAGGGLALAMRWGGGGGAAAGAPRLRPAAPRSGKLPKPGLEAGWLAGTVVTAPPCGS